MSCDDNEVHNLRALLNEVFGEDNFVAALVWQKAKKGDSKLIARSHEYVVVYARNQRSFVDAGKWRRRKPGVDDVLAEYERLRATQKQNHAAISEAMRAWYSGLPKGDSRRAHERCRYQIIVGSTFLPTSQGQMTDALPGHGMTSSTR